MPELSVTEEQLERIEALRADLEAAFVEGYGHVRRRDAVDYLLDTHAPPVEERVRSALDRTVRDEEGAIDYPALQSVARNTEGVKGSGMTAEEMYEAVLEAKVREAGAGPPVDVGLGSGDRIEPDASDTVDDGPGADGTPGADGGGGSTDAGADTAEGDTDEVDNHQADDHRADGSSGAESTDDEEERGPAAGDAPSNGGSQLQQMMSLLNTHDDKWRKAESGDAPYEVDLPDGGTESARTKDDVKRILFTNY